MAASSAKDLIKKLASDQAFRQSVENAGTREARVAIIADHGFGGVTAGDVRAIARQQYTALTEDQLAAVAGGRACRDPDWTILIVAAAALLL